MAAHLLVLGHDEMLTKTRRWILEKHFKVQIASDLSEVATLTREEFFDLLILCHTVQEEEAARAVKLVHSLSQKTKVLRLVSGTPNSDKRTRGEICAPLEGPHVLLERVSALLGGQQAGSSENADPRS